MKCPIARGRKASAPTGRPIWWELWDDGRVASGAQPDWSGTGALLTATAVEALTETGAVPEKLDAVHRWIRDDLTKPHPDLGRKGDVCPFICGALRQDTIYYAPVPGEVEEGDVISAVASLAHLFGVLKPIAGSGPRAVFKAVVVVFLDVADVDAPRLVVETHHETLKGMLVEQGMMLGEFHPTYQLPGTYNPDFPAGQSPAPLLALRPMVRRDDVFLHSRGEWERSHKRFFGQRGCPHAGDAS